MDVPDEIIFRIIASLSVFKVCDTHGWKIIQPELLTDSELIKNAKTVYVQIAYSNAHTMGKSRFNAPHLLSITTIYQNLTAGKRR